MFIRTFSLEGDLEDVLRLWARSGPGVQLSRSDQPGELRKKLDRDPDLFLVAEEDDRLIGTVLGGYDGRRGLIYHLSVDERFRRQGLGQALMEELEERMREKGCLKAYLMVTKDNPEAVEFYERTGWEYMDVHVLGKRLT